jgi:hypothetical protein
MPTGTAPHLPASAPFVRTDSGHAPRAALIHEPSHKETSHDRREVAGQRAATELG